MSLPENSSYLTTGEAAKALGVQEYELRYWEKQKLLIPMRISSGHRRFRRGDLRRGALIRDMFKQGYTAHGIKNALAGKKYEKISSDNGSALIYTQRKESLLAIKKEIQEIIKLIKG